MIRRIENLKAGGIVLDGSTKNFGALTLALTQPPEVASFLAVSALKGRTKELDTIYQKALGLKESTQKEGLRRDLDNFFVGHEHVLHTYLEHGRLSAKQKQVAREKSEKALSRLKEEAHLLLDQIFNSFDDSDCALQAHLQSFGERTNLVGVIQPVLTANGFLAIHLPAEKIFFAHPSETGTLTNAQLDRGRTLEAFTREVWPFLQEDVVQNHQGGVVFLYEGFVGKFGWQFVTYGYDGSDLSALLGAEAAQLLIPSGAPTAKLLKGLTRPLEDCSLQKLHKQLQSETDGLLVGLQAMEYAMRYGVTIIVHDINTGRQHIFAPSLRDSLSSVV